MGFLVTRDTEPLIIMRIEHHVGSFRAADGAFVRGGVERPLEGLFLADERDPILLLPDGIFPYLFSYLAHFLIYRIHNCDAEHVPNSFQVWVFYDERAFFIHLLSIISLSSSYASLDKSTIPITSSWETRLLSTY